MEMTQAASPSISGVKRLSNGQIQMTLNGTASAPMVLEATTDFKNWTQLQSYTLNGAPVTATDSQSSSFKSRFYRLRGGSATTPTTLPELANSVNAVFPAPEGFNTVQYAPNGNLGFIVWKNQSLIYRERNTSGSWSESIVSSSGNIFKLILTFNFSGPREDYRFQPSSIFFFDSSSRPHVFQASGQEILHYVRNGSSWSLSERINPQAGANVDTLVGAIGANNVFHLAALSTGSPRKLTYGVNKSGSWNWSMVSTVSDAPLTYWAPPFAPRWLSLAADSRNNAHISFRPSMTTTFDNASHPRAYSELKHASNASGQWRILPVMNPRDLSGEAANGASIAIGPDDKPRMVSWYDERVDTGSASESRLYYHDLDANGNWRNSIIATQPDGYVAGDGAKGTGFSPYLRFDSRGRAHILFLDHAAEHFGGIGQQEYAGNLRHGWWNGSSWQFETIYRQTAPLLQQIVYPAFAMHENEMAVTLLQRDTQWRLSSFPPLSDSRYSFKVFTRTMQ
ncbi:MAG: hypothetical protein ACO1QB_06640 [Verrucomicrobiales bacterium]